MIRTEEEHLAHYGILRRSGRYPWGSGSTQSQRNRSFLDIVKEQRKQGQSDAEIARSHGISVIELRAAKSIALAEQRQDKQQTARRLKEKGWSNVEIGKRMGGIPESSVRALLKDSERDNANALRVTSNMLKDQVAEKKYIDVGVGVEKQLGLTRNRLDTAVAVLKEQGYTVHNVYVPTGVGQFTTTKVLAPPRTSKSEVDKNRAEIKQITEYSEDHGRSFLKVQSPLSISSRRVGIIYGEEGGAKTDGMIYIRPGVKDLSIGNKHYAQVRIMIDKTHYIKGMAIYKEDLPAGRDLMFSTKQHSTGRKKDAMKEISDDPDNPFGTIIRQIHGPNGKVISAVNIVGGKEGAGEEGSWDTWKKSLSSQMLSKQSPELATQQLNLTYERRKKEFDEINSLTNATVRKDLLLKFADQTDAAAVHLAAAAMPRQATKVLLPVPSMKPDEIYAPTFRNGERVALVRHPHGGPFEIPQLTVNNRNREARKLMGTSPQDAVGIHHKVAERLSGADFDGDTVLVIPNPKRQIKSAAPLEGLKGFDPMVYKLDKDSPIPRINGPRKQKEMGKISNLITDMSLKGAGPDKMARAIKHSMVVIDSEKHGLDFKRSEKDHGILSLKEEYQGGKRRGAQTLISRAGAEIRVPHRVPRAASKGGPIDPVTGKKVYERTGKTIPVRGKRDPITGKRVETGKTKLRTVTSKRLAETDDAFSLILGRPTQMEIIYAGHSNRLKALANSARKEAVPIKGTKMSPSAKKVYAGEVKSLDHKLNVALRNAPRERQAQLLTNAHVSQKRQANPHIEEADVKKIREQTLTQMRIRTGANKTMIKVTQSEWDAIQAGAISTHKLEKILKNTDMDSIKQLAMPKHTPKLTSSKLRLAETMLARGYTQAEVADRLGIGLTTLKLGLQ